MSNFIDVAMLIIEEEGLNGLTMPKLAERADVAVGGLYRYFDSKDGLHVALQVRCAEAFVDFVSPLYSDIEQGSSLEQLHVYANSLNAFSEAHPLQHHLLDSALSNPTVLLGDTEALAVDRILRSALEPIALAFKEAENEGALTPGHAWQRTYALWAAMHGVGHFKKRDRFLPDILHANEIRALLIQTLFRGWERA